MGNIIKEIKRVIEGGESMEPTIDIKDNFMKDVDQELEFLNSINRGSIAYSKAITGKPDSLNTELDLMILVYNEQLERLMRIRFDAEIFRNLEINDPANTEWKTKRISADKTIIERRETIRTIRKQITEYINAKK